MVNDRAASHPREEIQSSASNALNTVDILGDKRAWAIGAAAAVGIGAVVTHKLKPEILKSVVDGAKDFFRYLGSEVRPGPADRISLVEAMCMSERSGADATRLSYIPKPVSAARGIDLGTNMMDSRAGKALPVPGAKADSQSLTASGHPGETSGVTFKLPPYWRRYYGGRDAE